MSLKAFHIVFIVLSILLTLGFFVWSLQAYTESHNATLLVLGIISLFSSIGLVIYGVKILKKLRHVSYL